LPVYRGSLDNVVGILHAKDLFDLSDEEERKFSLGRYLDPPFLVPEFKRAEDLFREMRRRRTHMAVVVDEHGGTAGIATIEDALEELLGPIQDEFDEEETPGFVAAGDRTFLLEGSYRLDDVEEQFGLSLPRDEAEEEEGDPLPARVIESIRRNRVALKAPVGTPIGKGFSSVNVRLRQTLELFANLRPVKTLPGIPARYTGVDLVVIRENTEDLYSGLEHVVVPGVVESLKIITEKASTRIARFAFDYSRTHARQKVSAVHKANIMKLSDGLFLDCCRKVAKEYADVAYDEIIVDNACMQLVLDPSRFDVMLLENLYGDIVSDLCAGFVGGRSEEHTSELQS